MTAKDVILAVIGKIGTAGGTGYVIEYTGDAIRNMTMEERLTVCNMTIEAGARAGLVSPDATTFDYLKGREYLPKDKPWDELVAEWSAWASDPGCTYDALVELDASKHRAASDVGHVAGHGDRHHGQNAGARRNRRTRTRALPPKKALEYMGLDEGMPDRPRCGQTRCYIGSCTNGRLEDLRAAAQVAKGYKMQPSIDQALVVPGSYLVKKQAEAEGLDKIFKDAGFEWREPGCSMCLAMNADVLNPGDRCAATSNRNFEGRQGKGGRTHLVSPAMAAAAAVTGHFVDVRNWEFK